MIYTSKIQKALNFSIRAHKGQKRMITKAPYVTHPFAVALILARISAGEDVIVAGLLHDTIEDCGVTREEIESEFGSKVAGIVDDLTEDDSNLPWDDRKKLMLEKARCMEKDSILVKSADVLHNITDLMYSYALEGEKIFDKFSASKGGMVNRYEKLISTFEGVWKENPLLPDVRDNLQKLKELWSQPANY